MTSKVYRTSKDVGQEARLTPAGIRRLIRVGELIPDAITVSGIALFEAPTIRRFLRRRNQHEVGSQPIPSRRRRP